MIRVFNHEIKEGERAYFTVPAGELAHKAVVQLPVIVVAGKKEGPVLWINGTVHGVMHATVEGDIDLNLIAGSANEEQDDDED